jgi:predicted dienelactone hydrolase
MRRTGCGLVLGLLAIVTACAGQDTAGTAGSATVQPGGGATATAALPARAEVQRLPLHLVDHSRPTPAHGPTPASDQRELVTDVWLPVGTGPFPTVVFSHGFAGSPDKMTQLFRAWAEAGYVVAAPAFPVSKSDAPGGAALTDAAGQPGDVDFVVQQLLHANETPGDPLARQIDPRHLGLAGDSLGGVTTSTVAFGTCCPDVEPAAVMLLDGALAGVTKPPASGATIPLLIVHADHDPIVPYDQAVASYRAAAAPKWFVTLHETAHVSAYEDPPDPADELVEAVTIAFWDRWLKGDRAAADRLAAAVTPESLAGLQTTIS